MEKVKNNQNETVFTVPKSLDGMNAGMFLRKYCAVSARLLTRLKRTENGITRNGELLRSIDTVNAEDIITLKFPDEKISVEPTEGKLDIIFENKNILVVNKPPFMPVHPVHEHIYDTLANIVAYHQIKNGENYTFRAVNRLDRNTSGIVIIAKDRLTASILPKTVQKTYIAICEGELFGSGTIDAPIALKKGHTICREVSENGIHAVTHWKSVSVKGNHTMIELILETGRTHQIRTHMAYIGHPLAGDDMYGGHIDIFDRQCLHCSRAEFDNPYSGERIVVECPADFSKKFENMSVS